MLTIDGLHFKKLCLEHGEYSVFKVTHTLKNTVCSFICFLDIFR